MRPLPVLGTVTDAWRELLHDWRTLVRIAWLPFLLQATGKAAFFYGAELPPAGEPLGAARVLRYLAYELAFWLVLIPAITAWHRHVILGPGGPPAAYAIGRAELRYLGRTMLVGLLIALIATAIALPVMIPTALLADSRAEAGEWGSAISSLAAGFVAPLVMLHGLLLFPAAAVGRDLRLGGAREMLRGNRWRLFAVLALSYAPAYAASFVLRAAIVAVAAPGRGDPGGLLALHLVDTTIQYAFLAVTVGALSFSYLRLAATRR